MELSCSDVCEYVDMMLRQAGYKYPDDEDHDEMMEALKSAHIISDDFVAAIQGVIQSWSTGNLAEAVNIMQQCFESEIGPIDKDEEEDDVQNNE